MDSALYMSSPINALLEGLYRDDISIAKLRAKGDFGIGTFNNLDGEMIVLDGKFYRIDLDGNACEVEDHCQTPFSTVCHFKAMLDEALQTPHDYSAFMALMGRLLPSDNMFYAIKVKGHFSQVITRSVPRTENYHPLSEATDHQKLRTFHDIEGTLAGFYTPPFVPSLNVPGYHFHFIDKALKAGGHLLFCDVSYADIELMLFSQMELSLPMTLDYLTASFDRDARSELEKAER
jgi:acetolactate decarboxylase